jgi:WD40 repeat protein
MAETTMSQIEPKPVSQHALDRQICLARYSADGKWLVAAGCDDKVYRWDVTDAGSMGDAEKETAPVLPSLPSFTAAGGWVTAFSFGQPKQATSGLIFAADSWGNLAAWKYAEKNPKPAWSVEGAHAGWIRAVTARPGSNEIATCGVDKQIRFWSAKDGKPLRSLSCRDDVFSLEFHPTQPILLSGDLKGEITQWDLKTGEAVRTFDASILYKYDRIQDVGGVRVMRFNPKADEVWAGGIEPSGGGFVQGKPVLVVIDWNSGKVKRTVTLGEATAGFVHDLTWHPDGYLMGVTSGQPGKGTLFLLKPEDEKPFFEHTKLPNCHSVTLHPNTEMFCFVSTNSGSNGNGRPLKDGEYRGNYSNLNFWTLGAEEMES